MSFPLSKFLFCCFCLNCPNSKCFNLFCFVKLCLCYDLNIMNDSWLGVHCLFTFFATMHNAYYVDCESWVINVSVSCKLHHQLGVWSLNYHHCDSHGVGESLIVDFLVLNQKTFLNWCLVHWVHSGVDASYGGSKTTRIPIPKVHINRVINIIMKKNVKNQCLMSLMWWLIN
jgi:hypothetical protein